MEQQDETLVRGQRIAQVLTRSWRAEPPRCTLSADEMTSLLPVLSVTGSAGLAWWTMRGSTLETHDVARQLQHVWAYQALRGQQHEQRVAKVVNLLQALDPLLLKGWSATRLYPDPGLRASGDIDIVVRPDRVPKAESIMAENPDLLKHVDLKHEEVDKLSAAELKALYDRSEVHEVGGAPVRILGPDDHLHLVALHFMRHFAVRPLWLCDIAVALESRPVFDWDIVLGSTRRDTSWILASLGLARRLLGAHHDSLPKAVMAPDWVANGVLRLWGEGHGTLGTMGDAISTRFTKLKPMREHRAPGDVVEGLKARLDRPFEFTILMNRVIRERQPVISQLLYGLARSTTK